MTAGPKYSVSAAPAEKVPWPEPASRSGSRRACELAATAACTSIRADGPRCWRTRSDRRWRTTAHSAPVTSLHSARRTQDLRGRKEQRLFVELYRGKVLESRHRVHVAVADAGGRLVAQAGDPAYSTFWRSGAKPFQALPLVEDGAVEHFKLTRQDLALACASHSSETAQVALVREFLLRIGCLERGLMCGPHRPLSDAAAKC